MVWWVWILIGFVLLGIELAATTLHVGFFGLGALIVGIIVAAGVGGPLWLQLVLFTVVSLVFLLFLRKPLRDRLGLVATGHEVDSLVGQSVLILESIGLNETGKAEMRGTSWSVRNVGQSPLSQGDHGRVQNVEGLTLLVRGD